jgi:hypothetical protein
VQYYEELRFYFLWTNPSNYLVAINIGTSLMFQGYVSMGGVGVGFSECKSMGRTTAIYIAAL